MKTTARTSLLALLVLFCVSHAAWAAPFVVSDSDFVGGVYELRYSTWSNTLTLNGTATALDGTPLNDLFLSNSGNTAYDAWQYYGTDANVKYLQATGRANGFGVGPNSTYNTSASANMGFDFSAVTGQVAQIELVASSHIGQFAQWGSEAFGDQLYGQIAAPMGSFGTGSFTDLYRFTGDNPDYGPNPGGYGIGGLDITSFLDTAWLADPSLLELKFGYELQNTDIPGRHLQLFRDHVGSAEDGFMLRVTLAPPQDPHAVSEPATLLLVAAGLVGLAGAGARRKKASPRS